MRKTLMRKIADAPEQSSLQETKLSKAIFMPALLFKICFNLLTVYSSRCLYYIPFEKKSPNLNWFTVTQG